MDGARGRNGCRAGRECGAGRARDAGWRLRYADASVPVNEAIVADDLDAAERLSDAARVASGDVVRKLPRRMALRARSLAVFVASDLASSLPHGRNFSSLLALFSCIGGAPRYVALGARGFFKTPRVVSLSFRRAASEPVNGVRR